MADGFPEYKLLQKRIEAMEFDLTHIKAELGKLQVASMDNRTDLDKLVMVVIGDPEMGLQGLAERFKNTEERIIRLVEMRF